MLDKYEHISDELMAAFLDGNTTKVETEQVLETMAECDEIMEVMDIVTEILEIEEITEIREIDELFDNLI